MGFERCHPAVNFIFFAAVLAATCVFTSPVYVLISWLCAFLYSIRRNGLKALFFGLALLVLTAVFAAYYSSYTHFGLTVLGQNFAGNNMTLESLLYGLLIGFKISAVLLWFSCIHSVVTADKVVYLLGRVSPRLSLFLAVLLRMVPRIKKEASKINTAQRGLGLGAGQGGPLRRVKNWIRIFSMMISWTIEAMGLASDSMRSRGSLLKGRSAFSIYRFDNRDRCYVVTMFLFMTLTAMAVLFGQTKMVYSPALIPAPVTAVSYLFFAAFAAFCLMPLALELFTQYRFEKSRKTVVSADIAALGCSEDM